MLCAAPCAAQVSLLPELKTIAELLNFKIMHHYLMFGFGTVTTPAGALHTRPSCGSRVVVVVVGLWHHTSAVLTNRPLVCLLILITITRCCVFTSLLLMVYAFLLSHSLLHFFN